jgi:hypothetical protein
MPRRLYLLGVAGLLIAGPVLAKSKGDKVLPPYFLTAHTVAVIIDPSAGIDPEDPRANEVARTDVEAALLNWGRYLPVMSTEGADLVIVIRKGHGRLVDSTISDPGQNNRPGAITPTDNGVGLGAQNGRPPSSGGGLPSGVGPQSPQSQAPRPQTEIGGSNDSFLVFDGKVARPLDGSPGWRYLGQDGLRPHNVPAVDEFRRAVDAADKAAAAAAAAKKP